MMKRKVGIEFRLNAEPDNKEYQDSMKAFESQFSYLESMVNQKKEVQAETFNKDKKMHDELKEL